MSDRIFIMNQGRIEQSGRPEEIYNAPRTRFVADFVGSANILDGDVIGEVGTNIWRVATPLGALDVQSETGPNAKQLPLSWRPETATFTNEGANLLTGTVVHRAFQGHFTDLIVAVEGTPQRLQALRSNHREGDTVTFSIAPQDLNFLEPDR